MDGHALALAGGNLGEVGRNPRGPSAWFSLNPAFFGGTLHVRNTFLSGLLI